MKPAPPVTIIYFLLKFLLMKISKLQDNNYYLNSSILFFKSFFYKRIEFINKKKFLFNEISSFINNYRQFKKCIYVLCWKLYYQ